jgi:hypothetical protein
MQVSIHPISHIIIKARTFSISKESNGLILLALGGSKWNGWAYGDGIKIRERGFVGCRAGKETNRRLSANQDNVRYFFFIFSNLIFNWMPSFKRQIP